MLVMKGMRMPMKGPWVATFAKEAGGDWFPLTHAAPMRMPMMKK